jgi:hypothetical protein
MTDSALLVCSSEAEGPVSVAHNRPLVECIWVPNYLVSFLAMCTSLLGTDRADAIESGCERKAIGGGGGALGGT